MNGTRKLYEEFTDPDGFSLELEHNGFHNGDRGEEVDRILDKSNEVGYSALTKEEKLSLGKKGFVTITLRNMGNSEIFLNGAPVEVIELGFCGDIERRTLLKALKLIVKELKENK